MTLILPSTYFGSIAYFRELAAHDKIQIESKEHFPKQSYRNRCDVLAANGIVKLSIPVNKPKGSKTRTEDILISESGWREIHWRTIMSAYQAAPYFDHYENEIKELIFNPTSHLLDFNMTITEKVIEWLDLHTIIELTSEFHDYEHDDLRISLASKHNFQKSQKTPYIQVFPAADSFKFGLSILDALLCEGPLARKLLY